MSTMGTPLLTIGIPTYNRAGTLRRAVESALAQDCGDVEILIADNASSDGTEAYCRALAEREPAVRYIRHRSNRGPTANFNSILRQARGDYFLFLSDDDWLFVAEIAALGKIVSLPEAMLYRSLDGTSASYRKLAKTLQLPAVQGRFPFTTVACAFAADVLWRSPVHTAVLAPTARVGLALLCAVSMARRGLWLCVVGLGRRPISRRPYLVAKALYLGVNRLTGNRLSLRFPGHSTLIAEPGKVDRADR